MSADPTQKEPSPYPSIRRIVTGHMESGHSTFESIDEVEPYFFRCSETMFADLFWVDSNRPDISKPCQDISKEHQGELCGKEGLVLRIIDTPPGPGGKSPFHRTETIDFVIVVKGEITLVLDNDEKRVCQPGDVVVQRGKIHAWHND
ncbi:uncharacterized protein LAESUDRAFT_666881 [Laetiporus sulphureus 93-53]|uniref:Cupin type-2 domain-containing protein n=1 Tax=Laetiporus sulphureus 93-53 TaxID=1314785 RepID=A0A165B2G9_9APHY|nr:uncharacterized protein LAESUDRAFT_666881 [Laetiporus sulphureus 93-53]KZT00102.1 hypothetical protein LAESUDRAFT_666881 [Laetiporus sulphureus 93-53]